MVNSIITNDIRVSVKTRYQSEFSDPIRGEYIHAYRITIQNDNDFPVQLVSRKWFIRESSGKQTIVNGSGVIGQNPILNPGEEFEYLSTCPLESLIGVMSGHYKFKRLDTNELFISRIPDFQLVCTDILN